MLPPQHLQGGSERVLVQIIAGRCGNRRLDQRKPDRRDLRLEDAATDTVDADAVVVSGDRRQQRNQLDAGIGPECRECEAAVLAAAPGKGYG
jgi:hypothetical protein